MVGRVTIAEAAQKTSDGNTFYVLMGTPPNTPPVTGGNVNYGMYLGLYKSSDTLLDFTKVMLRQAITPPPGVNPPDFQDINLLGQDASNAGALAVDPTDLNVVYVGGAVTSYVSPGPPAARADSGGHRRHAGHRRHERQPLPQSVRPRPVS